MNPQELNTLLRPYILRQQARKDKEQNYLILAALWLCILATALALTLSFALNH